MRPILCGHCISFQFASWFDFPHALYTRPNTRWTEHSLPDRKCTGGLHGNGNWPTDYSVWIAAVLFAAVRPVREYRLPAGWNRRLLQHIHAEYDFEFCLQLISGKLRKAVLKRAAVYSVVHCWQVFGQRLN